MYGAAMQQQGLFGARGEEVVLQSVDVNGKIDNVLCETTITQLYQNLEEKPIEAVYTFPLASTSILLGLTVTIGQRILNGVVVERKEAEERYEDAVVEGDRAIMLEQIQDGLYTLNVGNIQPEEKVSIAVTYVELLVWQDDTLRYHLPTTIAPKYGDPERGGMQPHQIPEYDLSVDNRFSFTLKIVGNLARASIASPSHDIVVKEDAGELELSFASGTASMDRDLVLNIKASGVEKEAAYVDSDGKGGYISFASFVPQIPFEGKIPPKSIKIVVDCSGSMSGDSIVQATKAVSEILDQLRPEDYFNIVLFGSTYKMMFDRMVKAEKKSVSLARRFCRRIDANLGGTEIGSALHAATNLPGPKFDQEMLLITDGEVWNTEEIIESVISSEHRVFSIGVGSAVSEGFVRDLADATGGACELVAPREKMADKIVRHFKRIYLPKAERLDVIWPIDPDKKIDQRKGQVFDGDTLIAFACFKEKPKGNVLFDLRVPGGGARTKQVGLQDWAAAGENEGQPGTIARIAMHHALKEMDAQSAVETAVFYQLISPYTNYLVIDEVEDAQKGEDLPELRKVTQMLSAGYGGAGTVCSSPAPSALMDMCMDDKAFSGPPPLDVFNDNLPVAGYYESIEERDLTPEMFAELCNERGIEWFDNASLRVGFGLFEEISESVGSVLEKIKEDYGLEVSEELIVLVLLHVLSQSQVGFGFNREVKRMIKKAMKKQAPDELLVAAVSARFADISNTDWGVDLYLT